MNNITVKKLSVPEFYDLFAEKRGGADFYYARFPNCVIFAATLENEQTFPIGYIIGTPEENSIFTLKSIFIKEECRRNGIALKLLWAIENEFGNMGFRASKVSLIETIENFDILKNFFEKNGYSVLNITYIYRSDAEKTYSGWQNFMEKRGERLVKYVTELGFHAVPLKDVYPALRESKNPPFNNPLDIDMYLGGKKGKISEELSFAAIHTKTGELAAYQIIIVPDLVSAIFEQAAVSGKYRHTGVQILTLTEAVNAYLNLGYKRAVYAVYADNAAQMGTNKRLLSAFTNSKKTQYNFIKKL